MFYVLSLFGGGGKAVLFFGGGGVEKLFFGRLKKLCFVETLQKLCFFFWEGGKGVRKAVLLLFWEVGKAVLSWEVGKSVLFWEVGQAVNFCEVGTVCYCLGGWKRLFLFGRLEQAVTVRTETLFHQLASRWSERKAVQPRLENAKKNGFSGHDAHMLAKQQEHTLQPLVW